MQKKKALIISYNDLNNSGVPNVIFQVVSSLSDEYDFDIVTFGDDNYFFNKLIENGTFPNLIKFETKTKKRISNGAIYHLFSYPKLMYRQAIEIMVRKKYDVLHSFKENYSWPFLKAAKKCGIQKRIVHSNIDSSRNGTFAFKLLDRLNKRKTLKYGTQFIGVSKLCCEHSFGKRKWNIIHNSYDENRFNSNIKYVGSNSCLTLVQIGTLNDNKNQLFSLQIANALKQKNVDFKLSIIGRETENGYQNRLNTYIKDNLLTSNVQIINNCQDITIAYRKSKYVLIPSKSEGASIVAIEAQACGITVFASSAIPSDMNVGGVIFLNKSQTPQDWAELILIHNEGDYSRKQYDTKDFSICEFKNKLLKIYNN